MVIEFISKKLASGKRIHELLFLQILLNCKGNIIKTFCDELYKKYNIKTNEKEIKSVINVLTNQFASGTAKNTYNKFIFVEKNSNDEYVISKSFSKMLKDKEFVKIISELLEFGISRYKMYYSNTYKNTQFVLYQKYTYEDVCRLLNWEKNEVATNIGGYKYDEYTHTFPVFINYDKMDDINVSIKYEDRFISSNKLISISKNKRKITSNDVQKFIHAEELGISVELFVRKNKDDKISKEFYYLGKMKCTGNVKEVVMTNTNFSAVEIEWILDTPVREDIYEYLIND